jgi:sodium/potassium-transporting ATPase subunit alpha
MSVSHVVYNKKITMTPIAPKLDSDTFEMFNDYDPHFKALQRIATINTDALFLSNEEDVFARKTKGDASEAAIIKFVDPIRSITEYREKCPRLYAIPFNSTNKWMLSIIEPEEPGKPITLLFKGAPERIMDRCANSYENGKVVPLTPEIR